MVGGEEDGKMNELAMLWVLNLSDGTHTLLDIAHKASLPFNLVQKTANILLEHNLLEEMLIK